MYLLKATSATFSSFRSQHIPGRVDKMRFNQHNKSSVFTLLMSFCVFFFASSVPIMEQHLLWKVSQDVTGATLFHQTFSSITSNQINVWCWKGHQLWSKWHTNQTICLFELCRNNWHERVWPNLDLGVNLSRRNQAISKQTNKKNLEEKRYGAWMFFALQLFLNVLFVHDPASCESLNGPLRSEILQLGAILCVSWRPARSFLRKASPR